MYEARSERKGRGDDEMICGYCEIENDTDHGYCAGCGSPLRDGGRPHPESLVRERARMRAWVLARPGGCTYKQLLAAIEGEET